MKYHVTETTSENWGLEGWGPITMENYSSRERAGSVQPSGWQSSPREGSIKGYSFGTEHVRSDGQSEITNGPREETVFTDRSRYPSWETETSQVPTNVEERSSCWDRDPMDAVTGAPRGISYDLNSAKPYFSIRRTDFDTDFEFVVEFKKVYFDLISHGLKLVTPHGALIDLILELDYDVTIAMINGVHCVDINNENFDINDFSRNVNNLIENLKRKEYFSGR